MTLPVGLFFVNPTIGIAQQKSSVLNTDWLTYCTNSEGNASTPKLRRSFGIVGNRHWQNKPTATVLVRKFVHPAIQVPSQKSERK